MGGGEERRQKGASDGICRALMPGRAVLSTLHALSLSLQLPGEAGTIIPGWRE